MIQSQVSLGQELCRRIKQVIELVGFEPDTNELISNTVFEWDQITDRFVYKGHSFLFDKIMETRGMTLDQLMEEFQRRADIIRYLTVHGRG